MMFNERIKQLREDCEIPQRKFLCKVSANRTCSSLPNRSQKWRKQLAATLDIDTASYCKIERGEPRARKEHIPIIAKLLETD
jgi:DNA-binding XRE family transcriptional regulator